MELSIEITADRVVCRQNGAPAYGAPLKSFLALLADRVESAALPEAIPEGVRFVRRRGDFVVLVLEEQPQVRTVRWLADESTAPFGRGAVYRTARLAFPFIVAIVAFRRGALTGLQQCFYRTRPLEALDDALLLPNLYNVADGYGQRCWLCLANLRTDLTGLSWHERVREVRKHLWGAGFNRSSEVHEGMSYWSAMRSLDPRFATLDCWERATQQAPYFPLEVAWTPAGRTVGDVIEEQCQSAGMPGPMTVVQLAQIVGVASGRGRGDAASAGPV